jgi:hypothetical protein
VRDGDFLFESLMPLRSDIVSGDGDSAQCVPASVCGRHARSDLKRGRILTAMKPAPPKVFISYRHESTALAADVLFIAQALRSMRIDSIFDATCEHAVADWPRWMSQNIDEADFVVVICSDGYAETAEGKEGTGRGVRWEADHLLEEVYRTRGKAREKFLPVILGKHGSFETVPSFLRLGTVFEVAIDDPQAATRAQTRSLMQEMSMGLLALRVSAGCDGGE